MFLYELAIELDQRSADVVDAADQLGHQGLGPTATLDREQVAAIRDHFASRVVPDPTTVEGGGPAVWAAPGEDAPAPGEAGPMAFAPPGSAPVAVAEDAAPAEVPAGEVAPASSSGAARVVAIAVTVVIVLSVLAYLVLP